MSLRPHSRLAVTLLLGLWLLASAGHAAPLPATGSGSLFERASREVASWLANRLPHPQSAPREVHRKCGGGIDPAGCPSPPPQCSGATCG
jgi:hypothetical protein